MLFYMERFVERIEAEALYPFFCAPSKKNCTQIVNKLIYFCCAFFRLTKTAKKAFIKYLRLKDMRALRSAPGCSKKQCIAA